IRSLLRILSFSSLTIAPWGALASCTVKRKNRLVVERHQKLSVPPSPVVIRPTSRKFLPSSERCAEKTTPKRSPHSTRAPRGDLTQPKSTVMLSPRKVDRRMAERRAATLLQHFGSVDGRV